MAKFTGEYTEVFTLPTDIEVAKAHFSNLSTIAANYGPLDKWSTEGDSILHITLKTQSIKGNSFTGEYKTKYEFTAPNTLEWKTVEGNMENRGKAIFSQSGGTTKIDYSGSISVEVPIGGLIAKMASPIVKKMVKDGIRDYVKRMKGAL